MSCIKCFKPSDFICNLTENFFCSDHIGDHLRTQGPHSFETLDTPISPEYSQAIKSELNSRIKSIQISKKALSSSTKQLITFIKNTSKPVINELLKLEKNYFNLLNCTKVSNSLTQKLDKIIKTNFSLKIFNLDLNDQIKSVFEGNLFTETKKEEIIEEVKVDSLDEKEDFQDCVDFEEKEKGNCIDEEKQEKVGGGEEVKQSIGQLRNEWSFVKKKEFAEACIGKSFRKSNDIKFSNDGKYFFRCKDYLGMII